MDGRGRSQKTFLNNFQTHNFHHASHLEMETGLYIRITDNNNDFILPRKRY